MSPRFRTCLFVALALLAPALSAGPTDVAIVAAMKIPDARSYSWHTTVEDDARTYDITGEATHGHTVMLTAADFAELAANRRVTVTSSAVGHSHAVTITCV